MSLNRTVLIGNITKDPEARSGASGTSIAQTSIAVNRYSKNEAGEREVDFFNLVAFGKTADYMTQYLKKGNRVAIEGRLQTRSWDDATSGLKRTVFEIVVDNVQNLSPREDNGDGQAQEARPPRQRQAARPAPPQAASGDDDESDPFSDD